MAIFFLILTNSLIIFGITFNNNGIPSEVKTAMYLALTCSTLAGCHGWLGQKISLAWTHYRHNHLRCLLSKNDELIGWYGTEEAFKRNPPDPTKQRREIVDSIAIRRQDGIIITGGRKHYEELIGKMRYKDYQKLLGGALQYGYLSSYGEFLDSRNALNLAWLTDQIPTRADGQLALFPENIWTDLK